MIKETEILRYQEGRIHRRKDVLLSEFHADLYLNGEKVTEIICTDLHLEELVTGLLFDRGYIDRAEDIQAILRSEDGIWVTAAEPAGEPRPEEPAEAMSFDRADIFTAYQKFRRGSELFCKTGSAHSARIVDSGMNVLFSTEDMGRHNAIDKIVGHGLKNRWHYRDKLLMVSSRMPLELVQKCFRAGILNVASVSVATMEAAEFARQHGMELFGMCRGTRFNIYAWRRSEND